jgi:hypothetical protein
MYGEYTNDDRAEWARSAANAFTLETYGGRRFEDLHPEDQYTAVQDLLTDLMHLVDRIPAAPPFDTLLASAEMHYEAELAEEAEDAEGEEDDTD